MFLARWNSARLRTTRKHEHPARIAWERRRLARIQRCDPL